MRFPELIKVIKDDFRSYKANTILKSLFVYYTQPSFRLVLNYRIGRYLTVNSNSFCRKLAFWYRYKQVTKRNCQISYKAVIGRNIRFPHPIGIVIGDGVEIHDDVLIWQNVTLGSHGKKKFGSAYPIIGGKVRIYEGATIIGGVVVGEDAIIAAKALVNIDVPSNTIAIGIPAQIKKRNEELSE